MSPDGRGVLVTGGNGGIGRLVVSRLLDAGAHVSVADRCRSDIDPRARFIPADLADAGEVLALGEFVRSSAPDIVVHLAGLNAFCPFAAMDHVRIDTLMQVNLVAPMQLTCAVLPAMIERGSGQVVTVGSVVGHIGMPYFAAYAASKAGIARFSEALHRELAGTGVVVTSIAPRAVATAMNAGAIGEFNRATGAREDPPERVAVVIVDAIARDLPRVTIGLPERFFVRMNSLLPSLVDRALVRSRAVAEEILHARSTPPAR